MAVHIYVHIWLCTQCTHWLRCAAETNTKLWNNYSPIKIFKKNTYPTENNFWKEASDRSRSHDSLSIRQPKVWALPGLPSGSGVKNQPANAGDAGDTDSVPRSGSSPGVGGPIPVFLPEGFHGQRSLVGYRPQVAESRPWSSTHTTAQWETLVLWTSVNSNTFWRICFNNL